MAKLRSMRETGDSVLLTPDNSVLLLVDYQPQMFFGVQSHDRQQVINNTVALAKGAKAFGVPTILTTISTKSFSGPMLSEIVDLFPGQNIIDRTAINSWEDPAVVRAVQNTGRRNLLIGGLWTEMCVCFPVLSALADGYKVYPVVDACGGATREAHRLGVMRMYQAGASPVTWLQVLAEWQRDWARTETVGSFLKIAREHGGAYGQGIEYVQAMAPQPKVVGAR